MTQTALDTIVTPGSVVYWQPEEGAPVRRGSVVSSDGGWAIVQPHEFLRDRTTNVPTCEVPVRRLSTTIAGARGLA